MNFHMQLLCFSYMQQCDRAISEKEEGVVVLHLPIGPL